MLIEIENAKQVPGEGFRRWFSDDYFELIVWFENDKETITGFQLCYDIYRKERALTWRKDKGYLHNKIDDGEETPLAHKRTPILVKDGLFDKDGIGKKFMESSKNIDDDIIDLVYSKIVEYY
ncbi:hypothetical protein ACFL20_00450 [Spirochaetota bacterium]